MFENIIDIVWYVLIALAFFVLALIASAVIYAIQYLKKTDVEKRLDAIEAAIAGLTELEEKKKKEDDDEALSD